MPKSRIIGSEMMNLFMDNTHRMNFIFLGELKERLVETLTPMWAKVPTTKLNSQ